MKTTRIAMRDKVRRAIEGYDLIAHGGRVVCGVSGGADSVALLHCLHALREEMGFALFAAHLNHRIRGAESDQDQRFVQGLCDCLGVELYAEEKDVPQLAKRQKKGIELMARQARYEIFERAIAHFGADAVAVAHHREDQAETVLLHLLRGSGLSGIAGMRPRRGNIIRPMLFLGKDQIEEYLQENRLSHRTDSTNHLRSAVRNRLRLDVIPYCRQHINSDVTGALCTAAELAGQDEEYLCGVASEALCKARLDCGGYDTKQLMGLPQPIKSRALRLALFQAGIVADVERVHTDMLCELLTARTGARLLLFGIEASVSYGVLHLGKRLELTPFEVPFIVPGDTITPRGTLRSRVLEHCHDISGERSVGCMDFDEVPKDAVVRSRRDGDRLRLVGGPGDKKLKDVLIDRKVPRFLRELPLLCSGNRVLFLPGHGVDECVKVTEQTQRMLWVEYCEQ